MQENTDVELLEAEQSVDQWQVPLVFAAMGRAVPSCWVCRAEQGCSEAPVALVCWDRERWFLIFSDCQASAGSVLAHTPLVAAGLMLLVEAAGETQSTHSVCGTADVLVKRWSSSGRVLGIWSSQ